MDLKRFAIIMVLLGIAVFSVHGQECDPLYQRYSTQHTYCKPANPTCDIVKRSVDGSDIQVILKEHNAYRSRVATGKETIQNMPKASNMLQMEWDDELAAVAQKHAEQCKFGHDCNDCRRVRNFGVGQNLYKETASVGPNLPDPNWTAAVKGWYDEVSAFNKNYISPFRPSSGEPTYGHFTQVAWADSWKIGCGYILYKEKNMYSKLYVCNYGQAGNMDGGEMYKKGDLCTQCPINSCCDKSCGLVGSAAEYPGLCKITNNQAPAYKPQGDYIFYCDFNNEPDCQNAVTYGPKKWELFNSLTGAYMSIVLNGGESSTLTFAKTLKAKSSMCLALYYRKGPNVAGQEASSTATETFVIIANDYKVENKLPSDTVQFEKFSMGLGWAMETKFSITFSVPAGKPAQYLEIKTITAKEGQC